MSRNMSDINDIIARIDERARALGLSDNAASVRSQLKRDAIRSIKRGASQRGQRSIDSETLAALAKGLDTSVHWLLTGEVLDQDKSRSMGISLAEIEAENASTSNLTFTNVEVPRVLDFPVNVPVLGTAAGSVIRNVEGFSIDRDIVDYVRRPPALAGRKDVYAIYVSGLSMEPLHVHGDLRFVDPKARPLIGDSVIVVTRSHDDDPGQAYIKILQRRTPERIVLRQLNPESMIEIPEQTILYIHKVLTMNDLFGV